MGRDRFLVLAVVCTSASIGSSNGEKTSFVPQKARTVFLLFHPLLRSQRPGSLSWGDRCVSHSQDHSPAPCRHPHLYLPRRVRNTAAVGGRAKSFGHIPLAVVFLAISVPRKGPYGEEGLGRCRFTLFRCLYQVCSSLASSTRLMKANALPSLNCWGVNSRTQ